MTDIPARYLPRCPEDGTLPDAAGIQSFLSNFYRTSDNPDLNEQWVASFTQDASVHIAADKAQGTEAIRALRERMWTVVKEREHRVLKVFPGRFTRSDPEEGECMLLGEATFKTRDEKTMEPSWTAHAVLRKEKGEWKFASYRVWVQI